MSHCKLVKPDTGFLPSPLKGEGVRERGVLFILTLTSILTCRLWAGWSTSQSADMALGQPDMSSTEFNYGGAKPYNFNQPIAVFVKNGKMFVSDYANNRVLIWNSTAAITAGNTPADVVLGQSTFTTSTANNGGVSASSLSGPIGLFSDGTKLFVADYGNNRVLIWNSIPTTNKQPADVVVGKPNTISNGCCQLSQSLTDNPGSVFSDGTRLFVADRGNNRVLIWNTIPTTNGQNADVVLGQPNFTTETANYGGSVSSATLYSPWGVYSDGTRLFVVDNDNHRVLVWNSIPTSTENFKGADIVLGQPNMTSSAPNNPALSSRARMNDPLHVWSDGTRLFVGDRDNYRVMIWNNIPTTQAQANSDANVIISGFNYDSTWGVWTDGGKLYTVDRYGYRVLVFNSVPVADTTLSAANLFLGQPIASYTQAKAWGGTSQNVYNPLDVNSDETRFFVADRYNHRVLVWNSIPSATYAQADIVLGQSNFNDNFYNYPNATVGPSTLYYPAGTFSDGKRLFVADDYNHRVLIWNDVSALTIGKAADVVLGQNTMFTGTCNSGGLSASSLCRPNKVYSDGTRLFVSDSDNYRVLIWNQIPTTNNAPANVVVGQYALNLNGANAGAGYYGARNAVGFRGPTDVYSDGTRLFVADPGNGRVLIWNSIPGGNGDDADIVLGKPDMTSTDNSSLPPLARFAGPYGVCSDGTRLFVTNENYYGNRTMVWNSMPTENGQAANFNLTASPDPYTCRVTGNKLFIVDQEYQRVHRYTNQATAYLNAVITPLNPGTIAQNQTVAFMKLELTSTSGAENMNWTGLKVFKEGSIADSSIQKVEVWRDGGTLGVFEGTPNDTLVNVGISTFTNSGSSLTIGLQTITASTQTYFVTLTLGDLPYRNATLPNVGMKIRKDMGSFTVTPTEMLIGGIYKTTLASVQDVSDTVTVTPSDNLKPNQILMGSSNNVVANFTLATGSDVAYVNTVNAFRLTKLGDVAADGNIYVKPWLDNAPYGQFDPLTDTQLAPTETVFSGGRVDLNLTSYLEVTTTPKTVFMVGRLAFFELSNGQTFGVSVDTSSFSLDGVDVVSTANLPYSTSLSTIVAARPNVTADRSTGTWWTNEFVGFTGNFGSDGVSSFRYVWDQNPTYTFADNETQWASGILSRTGASDGSWYLHVKAYDSGSRPGGTQNIGPFKYDKTPPSLDYCGAGGSFLSQKLDGVWISETGTNDDMTPNVSVRIRDSASGLRTFEGTNVSYSTDGGNSWSPQQWIPVTGTNGTTQCQTATAANIPFNQASVTQNKVRFQIWDMVGAAITSPAYNVMIQVAPDPVTNLTASPGANTGELRLTWTAPQDNDAGTSAVQSYTIKIATYTFGGGTFDSENDIQIYSPLPTPSPPGTLQIMTVTGLIPNERYYFHLKSMNSGGYVSALDTVIPQADARAKAPTVIVTPTTNIAPAETPQGAEAALLKLQVYADIGNVTWTGLTVTRSGNGADTDVEEIRLYKDNASVGTIGGYDYNTTQPGMGSDVDTQISPLDASFNGGTTTFVLTNPQPISQSTATYFVVYKFKTNAQIGKTQGAFLPIGALSVISPGVVSALNFPIGSSTTIITDGPSSLFIQSSVTIPTIAVTGSNNTPYLKLTMYADIGTVGLSGLTLTRLGLGADTDVTALRVYRDDDGTPGLNPATDSPMSDGMDSFGGGARTIIFKDSTTWSPALETITTTPKSYFVTVSISNAEVSIGNTIGLSLATTSSFLMQGNADNVDPSVIFPIQTGLAAIARPPNNMYVTFTNLAPPTISQDSMLAMAKLTLATDTGQAKFTGLKVNRLGEDGDVVSEVRLYKDVINQGNFDFSDLVISSTTFPQTGLANLNISSQYSPQTIDTSTATYYVVYKIRPDALGQTTAKITASDSFLLSNINTTVIGSFPVQSTSTIVLLTTDTLFVNAVVPEPPLEVTQGDSNVVMRKLRLNTNANQVTWSQATFTKQGTAQGSDISRLAIYKDVIMDGGLLNLNPSDPNKDILVAELTGSNIFPGGSLTANMGLIEPQYVTTAAQEYFVMADFSLNAIPFNTFGLSLADTNSMGITSPDFVFDNFPINPPQNSTIKEYVDIIYVNWTDMSPADANFGSTSLPMLKLALYTGFSDAKLGQIKFDRTGSLPQAIAGIRIYKDSQSFGQPGYSILEPELDLMVSTMTLSAVLGTKTVPMPVQLINATTKYYFVTVDLSQNISSVDVGKTFGLRLIDRYYLESTITAPNVVSGATFPIGTANVPLREPDSIVKAAGQDMAPAGVMQGDTDVPFIKLFLWTNQFSAKFSRLKVTRKGAGSQDSDLSQVRLYRDNGNGVFEPTTSDSIVPLTGLANFNSGSADIIFTTPETVLANQTTYFLTAGIAQIATPGARIGLMIADPFAITILPDDQLQTTGFPIVSGEPVIQATVDNMIVTPFVTSVPTVLLQGTANTPFIKVSLRMQTNKGLWESLLLEKTGALPDADITSVKIWKDSTGNGSLEVSSDTVVAAGFSGFVNGQAAINLLQPDIQDDVTSRIYFVTVDVSPTAEVNAAFALRLASVNSFKPISPDYTSSPDGINYPWDSLQGLITDKPDTLSAAPVNMVGTNGMYQNRSVAMAKLTLATNEDKVALESLGFAKLGDIPDDDFAGVTLWRDFEGDGLWDETKDIWFSSASIANGNADFIFSPNLTVAPQPQTMFLVCSLKKTATAGAKFGFKLTAAKIKIKSPDTVSSVNLPFETSVTFVRDGRTPTQPIVKREKRYVSAKNKLKFDWESEVYVGQLQEAEYAIGTSSGAADVVNWTSVGVSTDIKLINLTMENGKTYYVSVRTKSDSNFTSDIGVSMPVTVDVTPPAVPDKPQLIKDEGQVLLTWPTAVVGASGLMGYQVEERRAEKPVWRMVSGYGTTAPDESGNYKTTAPDESGNYNAPPLPVSSVKPIMSLDPNMEGTYFYRVRAVNGADVLGEPSPALRAVFGVLSSSEVISDVTAYPNPFDSREESVTINYVLNQDTDVTITMYDLFGYKVKEMKYAGGSTGGLAGSNDVFWDGANEKDDKVSHGAYLAYIEGAGAKKVAKIAVIH